MCAVYDETIEIDAAFSRSSLVAKWLGRQRWRHPLPPKAPGSQRVGLCVTIHPGLIGALRRALPTGRVATAGILDVTKLPRSEDIRVRIGLARGSVTIAIATIVSALPCAEIGRVSLLQVPIEGQLSARPTATVGDQLTHLALGLPGRTPSAPTLRQVALALTTGKLRTDDGL